MAELFGETTAEALATSGRAYASRGQYSYAFADLNTAIRLNRTAPLTLSCAASNLYAKQGQYDRAIAKSGARRTPIPAQGGQQSGDCGQQVMAA